MLPVLALVVALMHAIPSITIVGALRNIHREGDASPRIALDSILAPNVYAIGPVAYLQGEIVVMDGKLIVSSVSADTLHTHSTASTQAALLAYGTVKAWKPLLTTSNDVTLAELDHQIMQERSGREPMWIRIKASARSVNWHVIHWPLGEPIEKGNHKRKAFFGADTDATMDIIGLHAPDGAGLITHHTTALHLHAITERGDAVHIDELTLPIGTTVLVPNV
jgi:hypothetical protein